MATILVNTNNVHRNEIDSLTKRLSNDCWDFNTLTHDEVRGLRSIINHVINTRVGDKASELSYTDLLNLKNKLIKKIVMK